MEVLNPPHQFSFDQPNLDDTRRRWEGQFRTYYTACELDRKTDAVQVAILLHAAGPEAQEIEKQFTLAAGEKKDFETIIKKFKDYCQPRKNVFERYQFWQRDQAKGESVDTWLKNFKIRAISCGFEGQHDLMLRDKLVLQDDRVKERMLREPELTLQKAVDICHAAEYTRIQLQEMTQGATATSVDFVQKRQFSPPKHKPTRRGKKRVTSDHESQRDFDCCKCGTRHKPRSCPAYGKQCKQCQGWGHFGVFHKVKMTHDLTKKVHTVGTEHNSNDDSDDMLFFGSVQDLNLDVATVKNDDWVS